MGFFDVSGQSRRLPSLLTPRSLSVLMRNHSTIPGELILMVMADHSEGQRLESATGTKSRSVPMRHSRLYPSCDGNMDGTDPPGSDEWDLAVPSPLAHRVGMADSPVSLTSHTQSPHPSITYNPT